MEIYVVYSIRASVLIKLLKDTIDFNTCLISVDIFESFGSSQIKNQSQSNLTCSTKKITHKAYLTLSYIRVHVFKSGHSNLCTET